MDIINITDIADIANIVDIANRIKRSDFKYLLNSIALSMLYAFDRVKF